MILFVINLPFNCSKNESQSELKPIFTNLPLLYSHVSNLVDGIKNERSVLTLSYNSITSIDLSGLKHFRSNFFNLTQQSKIR